MGNLPEEKEILQQEITELYFIENHAQISQLLTQIITEIYNYKKEQNSLAEKEASLIRLLSSLKNLLNHSKEWNRLLDRVNDDYIEPDDLFDFYSTCSTKIPHETFSEYSLKGFLLELATSLMGVDSDHARIFLLSEPEQKISAALSYFINGAIGLASQYSQDFSPSASIEMVPSVDRAVINLEEFKNLYSQNLKQGYINLLAGLSSIYQQYQGKLSLFTLASSEQRGLRALLRSLTNEMIQVQAAPEPLYPRIKAILEAQEPSLVKLISPITHRFINLTILQDLTHIDRNALRDSLKFKITRNILKTLKNEGANKEERRMEGKNILIRIWERFFLPCFKSRQQAEKKENAGFAMQTVQGQRK